MQTLVQVFPPTHYVNFAQAILYRGAGFDIVWPGFDVVACIGVIFFAVALMRCRRTVAMLRGCACDDCYT